MTGVQTCALPISTYTPGMNHENLSENFVEVESNSAKGTIVEQSLPPGREVAVGTSITISVSKGPKPAIAVYDFTLLNSFTSDQIPSQISQKCQSMSNDAGGTINCNIDRSVFREGATGKVFDYSPKDTISAGGTITIYIGK